MVSMKSLVLGVALVAGGLGLGTSQAHAARIQVYVGGQAGYAAPAPGPGYVWVNGYWANGYWTPGYWAAPQVGYGFRFGQPAYGRGYDNDRRDWDRRDFDRDRDYDRRDFDRRDRDYDRRDGDRFRR